MLMAETFFGSTAVDNFLTEGLGLKLLGSDASAKGAAERAAMRQKMMQKRYGIS
jgi:hypothetical protein